MSPAAIPRLEPTKGRILRSAAFLCSLVVAALVYLLLALPGAHRVDCPVGCHGAVETVHLPRGIGDVDVAVHVLRPQMTSVVVDAAPPGTSGPALVALVVALVAAMLGFFPVAVAGAFHATVEAVLGVGRWHRTVVLHI